jgi:hypothetical protein
MNTIKLFYLLVFLQFANFASSAAAFKIMSIESSTGTYSAQYSPDSVYSISFLVTESEETVCLRGRLAHAAEDFSLIQTAEYVLLDSMTIIGDQFIVNVKFRDIIASRFLKLVFNIDGVVETIDLHPYSDAVVEMRTVTDKLIIGEQKELELFCSIPNNILPSKRWEETPNYDYYISIRAGIPFLSILPKKLGPLPCSFDIHLRQPVRIQDSSARIITLQALFTVEKSSIVFINFDMSEYVLTNDARTIGVKTLIDNNIQLEQGRTYRITDSEQKEEVLIGEVFVPKKINRGKAEAILKLYNYHDRKSGYLYIKDVDETKFITNFTVRPETSIQNVYVQRTDGIWRLDNIVYPGEKLRIKLEGTSLLGEPIIFDGGAKANLDTLLSDDSKLVYNVYIPKDVFAKKQEIMQAKIPSGRFLEVVENQTPREFDFVAIDYGDGKKRISDIEKPLMCRKNIDYLALTFNENKIDEAAELYGKQYFDIKVSMFEKNKKLIESTEIGPICVCPGENSVRSNYYDKSDCAQELMELNNFLINHTANLDDWSSVIVEFKHVAEKYYAPPLSHKIEIVLSRKVNYDLDLSFPAGLLTKEFGNNAQNLNNFSGISLAMVAQLSFYQRNKIAKYRPYKIGAGFLAFNMFSMSAEVDERDLGIVILASVYPSTKDRRLSFPLFLGGGYFLSKERFFMLVGPGIRISI